MGLDIEFEFADGTIKEVRMCYSSFHKHEICAGGGKKHFENMMEYDMTDVDGEYTGDIVRIMYTKCVKARYIYEEDNDRRHGLPVKATFM